MILIIIMLPFAALAMFCMYKAEFYDGKKYLVVAAVNYSIIILLYLIGLFKGVF